MKLIIATTFATLCLFSSNLLADATQSTVGQIIRAANGSTFLEGDKAKKVGSCGIRAVGTPNSKASLDEKYNALMASANHCQQVNDNTKADNFRLQASTCKTPATQNGNASCGKNFAVILGTCTPAPAKPIPVNKTTCDSYYKQSFVCYRAAVGLPASGVTGDMSLGMGCVPRQ